MRTVPEATEVTGRFIVLVVFLEKNKSLRIDKWLRGIEVQGSLKINGHIFRCVFDGSDSAVNQTLLRISAIRNIASRVLETDIQPGSHILLTDKGCCSKYQDPPCYNERQETQRCQARYLAQQSWRSEGRTELKHVNVRSGNSSRR